MSEKKYYVYILASRSYGTLYVGITSKLRERIAQHKSLKVPGFTKIYHVNRLVWYQEFNDIHDAIMHEKRIKRWHREWKIDLIEAVNPAWDDLSFREEFGLL